MMLAVAAAAAAEAARAEAGIQVLGGGCDGSAEDAMSGALASAGMGPVEGPCVPLRAGNGGKRGALWVSDLLKGSSKQEEDVLNLSGLLNALDGKRCQVMLSLTLPARLQCVGGTAHTCFRF
jgi:hypothetical protein